MTNLGWAKLGGNLGTFWTESTMRIHQSLRVTPAMKAGVSKTLWTWENLLETGVGVKVAA